MLWLCLHLPNLPLSALGAGADTAVVDQRGPHCWLITGTNLVRAGTPLAQALVLEPALRVRRRRHDVEQASLRSLAYAAYAYGQPVCATIQDLNEPGRTPRALLWVEIGSSLTLFGGLGILCNALRSALAQLGHTARIGIAPTRAGAALLACAGYPDAVPDLQTLRQQLDSLPIRLLHWPGELLRALHSVGFRSLRDLFAVPRKAFSQRFGTRYRLALDHLLGEEPEPFAAIVPPETFRHRIELPAEVEDTERLRFPLNRLSTELRSYLRARDRGLRGVTLSITHADAAETRLHVPFADPHRDAKRVFAVLHERLERDGLPFPARELALVAEDVAAAGVPQPDLFGTRAERTQDWHTAIERIRARLGDSSVWTPHAVADHRPEHGTQRHEPVRNSPDLQLQSGDAARPAFLISRPQRISVRDNPPDIAFERIESGWWDGHDVRRDYTVLDVNGARAWAFRDLASDGWYLHGWFS